MIYFLLLLCGFQLTSFLIDVGFTCGIVCSSSVEIRVLWWEEVSSHGTLGSALEPVRVSSQ